MVHVAPSEVDAKILNDVEKLKEGYGKNAQNKTKGFITNLSRALGLVGESSRYRTFKAQNGTEFTLRLSNHSAKVSTFDESGESEGLSIVIESNPRRDNDPRAYRRLTRNWSFCRFEN